MLKREMSKNPHLNNTGDQTLNDMIKSKTGGENLHLFYFYFYYDPHKPPSHHT